MRNFREDWFMRLALGSCVILISGGCLTAAPPPANVAEAVQRVDKAALRELLQKNADVNTLLADGSTPLHWAVESDDLEIVDLLLQARANVKAKDRYGLTPLYFAATNGNDAIVRRLLKAGADPNDADANGDSVLMGAVRSGNLEAVKALIESGAKVNGKDSATEQTPLMWAVRSSQPAIVQTLIDKGAEINARTRTGKAPPRRPPGAGGGSHGLGIVRGGWPDRGYQDATPGAMSALLYAARDGRLDIVKQLIAAKADVNQPEANGITPLLMAIGNDHPEVALYLLGQGADPKSVDWWGRTPLWTAVDNRNREIGRSGEQTVNRGAFLTLIKNLLDRNVDVNARTKEVPPLRRFLLPLGDLSWVDFTGQTPFLRAALSGDVSVMRLLLEKGADPNLPAFAGTTPLMAAAGVNWMGGQTYTESKESLMEAVKLCLEHGADVNAKNSMGLTALTGAANRGSDDIFELLVQKGARLDVKDNEGRTLMNWAEGVFLATNPPEAKPSTIALIKKLTAGQPQ
jgi:ankyrin repeat protein